MNFVVVTNEWLSEKGIIPLPTMRKSKDGSKILLHKDYFNMIARKDEDGNTLLGEMQEYAHNSEELSALLSGEDWAYDDGDGTTNASAGYIQAAAIRNMMVATKAGINTLEMTDDESLQVKDLYPQWEEYVDKSLEVGMKVQYDDKLYKVRQDITTVLSNQPPSIATAALYEEINESHTGTSEDPIPYNNNMELVEGKYYSQDGVTYLCTRSTGQAVYNPLKDLVGIYVEVHVNL